MEITIHLALKKLDDDYRKAMDEYIKRTFPYCKITYRTYKNSFKPTLKKGALTVLVTPGTDTISSKELAEMISGYNLNGISSMDILIPPAQDLSLHEHDYSCGQTISISSFTLGSGLTAVVLAEQLYRAYTILNNITYHK